MKFKFRLALGSATQLPLARGLAAMREALATFFVALISCPLLHSPPDARQENAKRGSATVGTAERVAESWSDRCGAGHACRGSVRCLEPVAAGSVCMESNTTTSLHGWATQLAMQSVHS